MKKIVFGWTIKHKSIPLRAFELNYKKHPNFIFWVNLLFLNSLIFLPAFLLNFESSTFIPNLEIGQIGQEGIQESARTLLVWRNNLDLFRINAELIVLIALWVFLPIQHNPTVRRIYAAFSGAFFFLILLYEVYGSLSLYFYQMDAIFYAHYRLLLDGLGFLVSHLQLSWFWVLFYIISILVWVGVIAVLLQYLTRLSSLGLNIFTKWMLFILLLFVFQAFLINRNLLVSPKGVVQSFTMKVQNNIANSVALANKVQALDNYSLETAYNYDGHTLIKSPNIYLIFVESYGSILYKREAFLDRYISLLQNQEMQLKTTGWQMSSAMSESPTWGGGSWLAYTSLLFGFRVDSHPQYLSMLEKYQNGEKSDFGSTMKKLGYQYVRATSLAVELDDQEWQQYVNFFGVNKWVRYRDLEYQGRHYGWGPSPPDQFTLSATHELITEDSEQPFLLFLITQNSHYPWQKVPQVVQDWRSLNDGNAVVDVIEEESLSRSERQDNYFHAISYELEFLTNYIINEAEEDDIFILIGDHQPGYITRRDDGFETPLHIISKDLDFIQSFQTIGFDDGLEVKNEGSILKHEGFYSLFMQIFLKHYGAGINLISPYLPDGVQLEFE